MGRLLAVHAISAHRWHALCAISDVRRRTPLPEAIRYWEMFDLRQLLPRVCRFGVQARRATRTEDEAVEGQMIATLQRAASATAASRTHKIGVKILMTRLGEGFDAAFAACVLLGALWLLVSGYA